MVNFKSWTIEVGYELAFDLVVFSTLINSFIYCSPFAVSICAMMVAFSLFCRLANSIVEKSLKTNQMQHAKHKPPKTESTVGPRISVRRQGCDG